MVGKRLKEGRDSYRMGGELLSRSEVGWLENGSETIMTNGCGMVTGW